MNEYKIPPDNFNEKGFSLESYMLYKFMAVSYLKITSEMVKANILQPSVDDAISLGTLPSYLS